jgi:hypothetical protein
MSRRSTTPTTTGIQPTTAIMSRRDTVTVTMIGVMAPTTATIRIGTDCGLELSGGIE